MTWRYEHFTEDEFKCRCGCGAAIMDHYFMTLLVTLRKRFGKPIHINSGYRCQAHDAKFGGKGNHSGKAADVRTGDPYELDTLHRLAIETGFTGLGMKFHGDGAGRYLHVDTSHEAFTEWTYP